jgi:hypothetical protein
VACPMPLVAPVIRAVFIIRLLCVFIFENVLQRLIYFAKIFYKNT